MKAPISLVLLAALSACGSQREEAREHARLASLSFDVPAGWSRTDSMQRGVLTAEWRPEHNERRESITVIRTELAPALAKAGPAALEPYLAAAQRSLPSVRPSRVKSIETARGLKGMRVDAEFVPVGQEQPYRRVHVALVDPKGTALIHVLYTAKHPDRALTALELVLANLRREEA